MERRLVSAALPFLCLSLTLASTPAAIAQPTERVPSLDTRPADTGEIDAAPWHRVDTAHYALIGDVPARTLRGLAGDLEVLQALLEGLNPGEWLRSPRAQVIVFAGETTFARHAPLTAGDRPAPVSGFFLSHPHGDFVVVSAAAEPDVHRVLYHEALHRFVRHHLPEAPLWLNEGLAEFYSTLEVAPGEAWVGRQVIEHVVRLQRGQRRPLAELLEVTAADAHAEEEAVQDGAFYAESWALVHHLLTAEEGGRAAIARYAGRLRDGHDPIAAFTAEFGDLASLDRRIDGELRRAPREPARVAVGGSPRHGEQRPAPSIAPADLHYRLGWLLAHHSPARAAAAREAFDIALGFNADHAGATMGLGWLEELAGDHDAARQLYARAAALDQRDPLPRLLEAESLLRLAGELRDSPRRADRTQATLEAARDGFRAALALEDDLAEAWAGLGASWVADPAPMAEGLEALRQANRRLPLRDDVLYNLILLEARLGSPDRAAALFTRLEQRADPDQVQSAREALLRIDLLRADRLLREGSTAEAVEIMSRVLRETGDPELAVVLASRLEKIRITRAGG
jgi:tetratricopeptide (TPR) repeat protein